MLLQFKRAFSCSVVMLIALLAVAEPVRAEEKAVEDEHAQKQLASQLRSAAQILVGHRVAWGQISLEEAENSVEPVVRVLLQMAPECHQAYFDLVDCLEKYPILWGFGACDGSENRKTIVCGEDFRQAVESESAQP